MCVLLSVCWQAPRCCPGGHTFRAASRDAVRALTHVQATASSSASTGNKVLVRISVPFRVSFGEVIKVVGSGAALGTWDVLRAPRFTWTEGDIWVGNLLVAPGQEEFKVRATRCRVVALVLRSAAITLTAGRTRVLRPQVVVYNERTKEARWETSANRLLKVRGCSANWPFAVRARRGEWKRLHVTWRTAQVPEGPGTLTLSCYWGQPSTSGWFVAGKVDLAKVQLSTPDAPAGASSSASSSSNGSSKDKDSKAKESSSKDSGKDSRERSSSPEPSVLLSRGWDAMLKRSGSPEPAREPAAAGSSSSSASKSSSAASSSGSKSGGGWAAKLSASSASASAKASRCALGALLFRLTHPRAGGPHASRVARRQADWRLRVERDV